MCWSQNIHQIANRIALPAQGIQVSGSASLAMADVILLAAFRCHLCHCLIAKPE
ncbi:hypothetical protein SAMN05428971_0624 [Candidatus Pantoea varia]|uniref:Uncharacterized protein n=1 Tax=Candidatus Pantoea varia TaxID=1881036 RepID=A0A1I4XAI5_9GAMM|nr:hypothetical protein SAMN05428971_0624 [Pantoea varia]